MAKPINALVIAGAPMHAGSPLSCKYMLGCSLRFPIGGNDGTEYGAIADLPGLKKQIG
jgi:hypothetical protein